MNDVMQPGSTRKAFWAIALTFVAGWVDTGGYLWTTRVLTGNMSGNTVESALFGVPGHSASAWAHAFALWMFLAGLLACAFIHDALKTRGWKSTASMTLSMELALLIAATLLLRHNLQTSRLAVIGCLAFALGLQNATLTRVGLLNLRTTHVTGTISQFAESLADYVFWVRDRWGKPGVLFRELPRQSLQNEKFQQALITFALWVAFFLGALGFVSVQRFMGVYSLVPPTILLMIAIAADLRSPMQTKRMSAS